MPYTLAAKATHVRRSMVKSGGMEQHTSSREKLSSVLSVGESVGESLEE